MAYVDTLFGHQAGASSARLLRCAWGSADDVAFVDTLLGHQAGALLHAGRRCCCCRCRVSPGARPACRSPSLPRPPAEALGAQRAHLPARLAASLTTACPALAAPPPSLQRCWGWTRCARSAACRAPPTAPAACGRSPKRASSSSGAHRTASEAQSGGGLLSSRPCRSATLACLATAPILSLPALPTLPRLLPAAATAADSRRPERPPTPQGRLQHDRVLPVPDGQRVGHGLGRRLGVALVLHQEAAGVHHAVGAPVLAGCAAAGCAARICTGSGVPGVRGGEGERCGT